LGLLPQVFFDDFGIAGPELFVPFQEHVPSSADWAQLIAPSSSDYATPVESSLWSSGCGERIQVTNCNPRNVFCLPFRSHHSTGLKCSLLWAINGALT